MGVNEHMIYRTDDLAKGENVLFAATGITDGSMLNGVRFGAKNIFTHSLVMRSKTKTIRFIEAFHNEAFQDKVKGKV